LICAIGGALRPIRGQARSHRGPANRIICGRLGPVGADSWSHMALRTASCVASAVPVGAGLPAIEGVALARALEPTDEPDLRLPQPRPPAHPRLPPAVEEPQPRRRAPGL